MTVATVLIGLIRCFGRPAGGRDEAHRGTDGGDLCQRLFDARVI
jgi:hypothetical protein